ncbi:YciI family protein [Kaistella polysaccharea]|uniref:YciI family protein n=1 Tax=Kaistella polysaccharea TaxID=2878534 RepID=UPI001CF18922|nr:YciI family protein [Kaistella polysaccharea]
MKTVVLYENPESTMEQFMDALPRHQAVEDQFVKEGKVLGIGAFANPGEGAMAIFIDKISAEEFVKQDPFASENLYTKVTIKEWNDEMK